MQPATFPTRLLALASALVLVSSCGDKARITPPADLLYRTTEPPMSAEAVTSEDAYERDRDAKIEWGRANADMIDRACQWMKTAGVVLQCRKP